MPLAVLGVVDWGSKDWLSSWGRVIDNWGSFDDGNWSGWDVVLSGTGLWLDTGGECATATE